MSYTLLFLLFGSTTLIYAETPSDMDRVVERLQNSAKQLSIIGFSEPPDAVSYLNHDLIKNSPHKMNLTNELTRVIHEWSPRLLALDPTCPYYFSKFNNASSPDEGVNLLSYLQSLELNQTLVHPFVNVLPQSYRNALVLLSIFQCSEHVYPVSSPFFHNIELILGPGKTELALERQSDMFSQLYCSLYGSPYFLLINQTKQPTITYNSQTLLSQDNLADVDFSLTSLASGTCLFVPPDWTVGAQLNNSISILFTLKKIEIPISTDLENELLPCTDTGEYTLETLQFAILDTFNVTDIGLIVYFYQYLNPPMFDKKYTSETFFEAFQEDKNVSQLIMTWTPEITKLIKKTLFNKLDINHDKKFNVDDYFQIKQSNLKQLQKSILDVLEKLRQAVLAQYNELSATITKLTQQFGNVGGADNAKETLEAMMENLPDQVKDMLQEQNVDVKQLLNKGKGKKPKRPAANKQRVTDDDASILFDKKQDDDIPLVVDLDQEEEITAEPYTPENEIHRTDL